MASTLIKKPYLDDEYTQEELDHLVHSTSDPIYFIENFIKVQHPTKGSIPLQLYPFQKDMIKAYHENRFSISLTSRQMGKCVHGDTMIAVSGNQQRISDLIPLSLKDRIVKKIEDLLISLLRK